MGPRLSTGGNGTQSRVLFGTQSASMGPRLSTGGNAKRSMPLCRDVRASMGPRLSTGGNRAARGGEPNDDDLLQWGPVSRRGGTEDVVSADAQQIRLQWGPVSRRGGTER